MTRKRAATLLADDWRSRNPEVQEPKLSQNLALVERLREVGALHGRSPGQVAIAWTLRHPAVTGAIVGGAQRGASRGAMHYSVDAETGRRFSLHTCNEDDARQIIEAGQLIQRLVHRIRSPHIGFGNGFEYRQGRTHAQAAGFRGHWRAPHFRPFSPDGQHKENQKKSGTERSKAGAVADRARGAYH